MRAMRVMRSFACRSTSLTAVALLAVASAGCDERDPALDANIPTTITGHGLERAVAVMDPPADRLLMLGVDEQLAFAPKSFPIGEGYATSGVTSDRARLLVLSRGAVPRRSPDEPRPQLSVFTSVPDMAQTAVYTLSDPLSGLALDPESKWAVVFAGESDTSFVQNPNELVLVDLERGPEQDNPFPKTLRSFGGRPEALTFTPELDVPGGPRRFLVVQTDRDLSLVGLDDLERPEITIQPTGGSEILQPGGVAVNNGDPGRDDDSRVAIRFQGHSNVIIVDLLPLSASDQGTSPQTFRAVPNVVYVGGPPSDVEFVNTDGGLRLAALVPNDNSLVLVDPNTGIASQVEVGGYFQSMSLITSIVGETDEGSDVALLWSGSSAEIAFVALGTTVGKPYKAVERLKMPEPVGEVLDAPPPYEHLKILRSTSGRNLVVLDLLKRTASPISASTNAFVTVAPEGTGRVWISGGNNVAQLNLESLHPQNLLLSEYVHSVYDIGRSDGGRALVALHQVGALGATVLDADNPKLEQSRQYVGLLLGELP